MRVFVLDNQKEPLMPCQPARARQLLRDGKAAVFRRYPFTIILKKPTVGTTQPISLNVDPGSKTTGIALIASFEKGDTCIFGLHIDHRGHFIKGSMDSRRAIRHSRRNRKVRYRKPRFQNRVRPKGWLPPSLMSRVHNIETWTKRLLSLAPISEARVETVRFDMQIMEKQNISGTDYQRGTLYGYEVREYLLQRHKHQCAYCNGLVGDPVLNIEHVHPRANGGTDKVTNLVIACRTCNEHKGSMHPKAWMQQCSQKKNKVDQKRALAMTKILKGHRPTLRDAASVNATRYAVGRVIKELIPKTSFWSGGRTKKNRTDQGYPKDHWVDAACIGDNGNKVKLSVASILLVKAQGHGSRQMCRMNRYGFPRTSSKGKKSVFGFKTGDLVKAIVTKGARQGIYIGRVAVRASGSFNITHTTTLQGISYRYCTKLQASDGYNYLSQNLGSIREGDRSEKLAA